MANAAGFISESIWRDPDWRQLSRGAQALYLQLLSQKELDCAGVLPLQPNKWSKGCDSLTVQQVWDELEELQNHRFVYFDTDTDEAMIRTYVRNSNVMRVPNVRRSAERSALLVGSPILRGVLAEELRATGHPDFIAVADQINPLPNPLGNPSPRVSERVSEGFGKPTGTGMGTGANLTLVINHLGEPPSQFCSKHPGGTDKPCRPCAYARDTYPKLLADWKAAKAAERQRAIENCSLCDDHGDIAVADNAIRKCHHQQIKENA